MLIVPSVSRRTVKGSGAVVVICVDRGGVGGDKNTSRRLHRSRRGGVPNYDGCSVEAPFRDHSA
jgi:hypothetical protein